MKIRRLISALLVLFCGIILLGCSNKYLNIESLQEYYLTELVPYAFFHKMEKNDDSSFLMFDRNYVNMWISFDTLDGHEKVDFIITSCKRKKGQIEGTASRIESKGDTQGKLITYSFWSDDSTIYLQTLVEYKIFTAADSHELVTVERNTIVAKFARTTPPYIGGDS